jgi:tetratricopeptide (TPR) repeat protein
MATVRVILLLVVLSISSAAVIQAQRTDDRDQLRMAAAYERGGDQRGAARIYQELYAASPANETYFQGVVRTLSALQQFDALMPIVEAHATARTTVEACILAGSLRARRGERDAAVAWWKRAQQVSGDKEQVLVQISNEQRKAGLYDLALLSIREARTISGREADHPYSEELVGLLTLTGGYAQACDEIIDVFTKERDLYRAMRSLTVILASEGAAERVMAAVERLSTTEEENLRLQQWVYRQMRAWSRALTTSIQLDRITRANGNEILMFAEGARNDEQFDIALLAYDNVLSVSKDQRARVSAAYGSVKALEQQMRRKRELSQDDAKEIVRRYDEVVSSHPTHPLSAEALLNAARLEDAVLFQPDRARERLQRIQNQWRGTTTYAEAALLLASSYISINKDAEAVEVLNNLIASPAVVVGDRKDLARLMLADMAFWKRDIVEARRLYGELAAVPPSPAANDAIDRLLLLDLAQDDSVSVSAFAEAEGYAARRSFSAAYEGFMRISEATRDVDLRDRACVRAMESALSMRSDTLARAAIGKVVDRVPETIWGDRVLLRLAEIEERSGNVPSAMNALSTILVAYPRSIFVPTARDRLRRLRGDS